MSELSALRRQELVLHPDPSRVVVRPFRPSSPPADGDAEGRGRAQRIAARVAALDDDAAERDLADVLENFGGRHRRLLDTFAARADEVAPLLPGARENWSLDQWRLLGSYFLHEYSFEAAALFNPSIVPHPDQSGLSDGELRVVLSLRAVGEGHVSSITFRTGVVGADGAMDIAQTARLASTPRVERLSADEVDIRFDGEEGLDERVVFPVTPAQSNGIEDARFVRFEDGRYYATYTAYSGRAIRSELLETEDFVSFRMCPMTGDAVEAKGMALFPRRIGGRYLMIGRQDNESIFLLGSDNLRHWDGGARIVEPRYPWEFVQMGNCGSPIEIDEGWLLLTHGVGAMRKYSIGAVLLDRDDPSKLLARTPDPIIRPEPSEREGYVPNVVYSCGALRHGDHLVLPYAVSDSFTNFARIRLSALVASMR